MKSFSKEYQRDGKDTWMAFGDGKLMIGSNEVGRELIQETTQDRDEERGEENFYEQN